LRQFENRANWLPKNAIAGVSGNLFGNQFEKTANSKRRQFFKEGKRQISNRLNREGRFLSRDNRLWIKIQALAW